jgi:hypothetical protein
VILKRFYRKADGYLTIKAAAIGYGIHRENTVCPRNPKKTVRQKLIR